MTREQGEAAGDAAREAYAPRLVQLLLIIPAVVALWLVAAFSIAAAFYGFVRGLWLLLVFLGGMILYGATAVEAESFSRQLGRAVAAVIAPVLFGAIGSVCVIGARRLGARLTLRRHHADAHAPVVYLRSFNADTDLSRRPRAFGRLFSSRTEEQQLVESLRQMGPVVAVGRPGERLPRLGATRIYVEDAEWRPQILSWFKRAALVVIHVPADPTSGLVWEIERSFSTVPLSRLVFLLARDSRCLEWISRKIQEHGLTTSLPQELPRSPYRGACSGFVYFGDGKRAEFSALVKPPFFRRPFSRPLVPVYRLALEPVLAREARFWRPLPLAFGDAAIVAVWITFCAVVLAFGVYMRRTALVERETMRFIRELTNELPAAALQEIRGLDDAGAAAWIRSHFTIGLRYAPDDAVAAQAEIMRRLLAAASPDECAAIVKGTVAEPVLRSLLNRLGKADPTTLRAWVAFRKSILKESVAPSHAAVFPLSDADVVEAFARLTETLPGGQGERFAAVAFRFETANSDDQCWFGRTLLDGTGLLQEPSRSNLARAALGQQTDK